MSERTNGPEDQEARSRISPTRLLGRLAGGKAGNIRLAPAERLYLPRTARLQNEVAVSPKNVRLVSPDPEVMAAITEESQGKIRYFPTRESWTQIRGPYFNEGDFYDHISTPLAEQLAEDFPGKLLALRAVGTSINGDRSNSYMPELRDIAHTVEAGTEKPDALFNVAGIGADRVNQYACAVSMMRLGMAPRDAESTDALFPAILVYDAAGLQKAGTGYYSHTFAEGANPQDVLLAAYVLDCPAV